MADSQGGMTNKNSLLTEKKDETCLEDEINLIDYFAVLWKHKIFIFLATVLPALIIAVILMLSPRNYTATSIYDVRGDDTSDWNLNEINYAILLNRFYSEENLKKLSDSLQKNGLEKYTGQLNHGDQLRIFVKFEATPPFLDISKLKVTDPGQLNKLRDMRALLLKAIITGNSIEDLYKLSSLIRDNIENTILLYMVQEQLLTSIREYNNKLADIECNRFALELALKSNNETMAGLKAIDAGPINNKQDGIVLQFDIGGQNQFLPLTYQVQAAGSKQVELQKTIQLNEEKYINYKDLLDLNTKILAELGNRLPSGYTTEQFKSFLIGMVPSYEKPQLKDYLNSYIKRTENRISASRPVTEKPEISPLAKGTVKKGGLVLAIMLMVSVCSAFLREGLGKAKPGFRRNS
jgi:hypothetical protein